MLDIGAGEGYLTNIFKDKCQHIVGIDYCKEAVQIAKEHYGLECHQMVCTDLKFESESFDKVTCFELLEHITILQAKKTVSEIYRVLKRDGLLIGSTPIRTKPDPTPSTYSHIYEYTSPELRALLKLFPQVEITGDYFLAAKV